MPTQVVSRPKSETVSKQRKLALFVEQNRTRISTICIGTCVLIFSFGVGSTMIILGIIFTNNDYLIVGSIFAFGGVMILTIFLIGQCRPFLKNRQIHAEYTRQQKNIEEARKPIQVGNINSAEGDNEPGRVVTFY